jgi:hypothetical protein
MPHWPDGLSKARSLFRGGGVFGDVCSTQTVI